MLSGELGSVILALFFAYAACVFTARKKVILLSWLASLFTGWTLLFLGHEKLAIFTWLISTLYSLMFLFYFSTLQEEPEVISKAKASVAGLVLLVFLWVFHLITMGSNEAAPQLAVKHSAGALSGEFFLATALVSIFFLILIIGSSDHLGDRKED